MALVQNAKRTATVGPLLALCVGYFMVILDTTIVNVALPALHHDLHANVRTLQWVVDGYTLLFAALMLSGGALGDRLGARGVFQAGLAVFVLASIGCGVAPTAAVLIVARLVQGVGAALSVPASLSLLRVAYDDPTARARAVGAWGGVAGVAAAAGPVLGGLLVTVASWRLVFFVNVPVGLLGMYLTARHVPAPQRQQRGLDPVAQGSAVVALGGLTWGLIEGGHGGWDRPIVLAGFVLFACAGWLFVAVEGRAGDRMLPRALFGSPAFSAAASVGLLMNLGFYGELFLLNLYFQQVRGYSALLAGVALLPQMGMATIGSAASGHFTSRMGNTRPTLLIGLLVGGLGLFGMIATVGTAGYGLLVLPMLAAGFGMSFTMPAATTTVVDNAPAHRAGVASAVINTSRQVGSVVGVAVMGDLVAGAFVPGLRIGLAVGGAVFVLGAAVVALAIRK
jgi:DHA2 family methylenomycin A resistance protein-like MFS transporter